MDAAGILLMRFDYSLVSKRGKVPKTWGLMWRGERVEIEKSPGEDVELSLHVSERLAKRMHKSGGTMITLAEGPLPKGIVLSRFLAKVALECLAKDVAGGAEFVVDYERLDPIRNHARRGTIPGWETHTRKLPSIPHTDEGLVIFDSAFLKTPRSEWYFVLSLIDQEFAINISEPRISGYLEWLSENENVSPLEHNLLENKRKRKKRKSKR
jgi:hypothetical protein